MRIGFTLVELSIVFIVIGLLIGGTVAAQSMISTARTQSYIKRLEQYDVSISNFRTKYNMNPGDSPFFIPPGNHDGIINGGASCAAAPNTLYTRQETANMWAHLSQAQMLPGDYIPYSPLACGGPHANVNKLGGISFPEFEKNPLYSSLRGFASSRVNFVYAGTLGTETVDNYSTFSNSLMVMAIDSKIDDATLLRGKIISNQYYSTDSGSAVVYPAYCDQYIRSGGDNKKVLCKFWYIPTRSYQFY